MVNSSKVREKRFWLLWDSAGAVPKDRGLSGKPYLGERTVSRGKNPMLCSFGTESFSATKTLRLLACALEKTRTDDPAVQRIFRLLHALQGFQKTRRLVQLEWTDRYDLPLDCMGKVRQIIISGGRPLVYLDNYAFGIRLTAITLLNWERF